jgi:hypothetical protein
MIEGHRAGGSGVGKRMRHPCRLSQRGMLRLSYLLALWFPYVCWAVLGIVIIPLSFRGSRHLLDIYFKKKVIVSYSNDSHA